MTEADLQRTLIDAAKLHGWRVFHPLPGLSQAGRWSTRGQGHTGYPDLTLARDGVVLFAELKSERGRLTADQVAWRDAIGARWACWRPADLDSALRALRTGAL